MYFHKVQLGMRFNDNLAADEYFCRQQFRGLRMLICRESSEQKV